MNLGSSKRKAEQGMVKNYIYVHILFLSMMSMGKVLVLAFLAAQDSGEYLLIFVGVLIVATLAAVSYFFLRKEKEEWGTMAREKLQEALHLYENRQYEDSRFLFDEASQLFRRCNDQKMIEECLDYMRRCDERIEEIGEVTHELNTGVKRIKDSINEICSFLPKCKRDMLVNFLLYRGEVGELFSAENINDTPFLKSVKES